MSVADLDLIYDLYVCERENRETHTHAHQRVAQEDNKTLKLM